LCNSHIINWSKLAARDKSARDSKTIKSDSPHAGRENKEHDKERSNHKDHKDNILRRTDSDLNSSIPDLVSPRGISH
jgi:hypothetical protein